MRDLARLALDRAVDALSAAERAEQAAADAVQQAVAAGDDMVSGWLNDAAGTGIPFRLTLQQAARVSAPAADDIYVCENPAVLRVAAAELGPRSAALACTEGVPSAACHTLLGKATSGGARLHWRADFDWADLRIVGGAMSRHGAWSWWMTARDYRDALARGESTPLIGPEAASPWDPQLAPLMAERGRAVMEERLIATLIADLEA